MRNLAASAWVSWDDCSPDSPSWNSGRSVTWRGHTQVFWLTAPAELADSAPQLSPRDGLISATIRDPPQ